MKKLELADQDVKKLIKDSASSSIDSRLLQGIITVKNEEKEKDDS